MEPVQTHAQPFLLQRRQQPPNTVWDSQMRTFSHGFAAMLKPCHALIYADTANTEKPLLVQRKGLLPASKFTESSVSKTFPLSLTASCSTFFHSGVEVHVKTSLVDRRKFCYNRQVLRACRPFTLKVPGNDSVFPCVVASLRQISSNIFDEKTFEPFQILALCVPNVVTRCRMASRLQVF